MKFESIYQLYAKMVYNLALQYVQNQQDAEEITQDVFINIHAKMDTFRAEAELSTWIYRIAINKSLDFIKAKKRKKRFGFMISLFTADGSNEGALLSSFDHPGVQMEDQEDLKSLFEQINLLPAQQKTALILAKIEDKTYDEIAEIMETSNKAVESLVQRAKSNLKKIRKEARDDN